MVSAIHARPPRRGFLVSTFLPEVLHRLHEIHAPLPLGYICKRSEEAQLWSELPIRTFLPYHSLVSERLVREVHARGMQLITWTVNRHLFGTSPERIILLDRFGGIVFGVFQSVLRRHVVMSIFRLLDGATQFGRENLCLERLADVPKLWWDGDLGGAIHVRLTSKAPDYGVANRARQSPDSRQIRFAIGSPWRGREEIGLAVRQTRNPRSRVIQPLRPNRRGYHADDNTRGGKHFDYHLAVIECFQNVAIGLTGEPVPPTIGSGAAVNRNRRNDCILGERQILPASLGTAIVKLDGFLGRPMAYVDFLPDTINREGTARNRRRPAGAIPQYHLSSS